MDDPGDVLGVTASAGPPAASSPQGSYPPPGAYPPPVGYQQPAAYPPPSQYPPTGAFQQPGGYPARTVCAVASADDIATWDAQADAFDQPADHGLRDPAVRQAWRELLVSHLPEPPARVADLGCGTGTLSVLLA